MIAGNRGNPSVFPIDADGNLYSTEARGRLETLIPSLLKEAKASPKKADLTNCGTVLTRESR